MRERPFFFPTLHVGKTRMCHREACRAHWVFPDVTRPELKVRGRPIFILTLHVRKTRERKTGLGGAAKGTAQQHHKAGRAERHHKAGVRRAAGKGCHKEVSVIHEDLIIFALYEKSKAQAANSGLGEIV